MTVPMHRRALPSVLIVLLGTIASGVVLGVLYFLCVGFAGLGHVAGTLSQSVSSASEVPPWARVAPEQIAEARKHGVPAAFENDLGMRFVLIPAGTLRVDRAAADAEGVEDLGTEVRSAFYLGVHEVTNGQFRAFQADHHTHGVEGVATDGDRQPVGSLDFEDTTAFAAWLGEREPPRTYRLPTEAEWEHACRAGTRTRQWWGEHDAPIAQYANVRDLTWNGKYGITAADHVYAVEDGYVAAAPVGSFDPNAWGLFDMLGNASELCSGPYDPRRGGHVARGGSYADGPPRVLPTARLWFTPSPPNIGFRLVSPLSR